jgi:hypothetical protein
MSTIKNEVLKAALGGFNFKAAHERVEKIKTFHDACRTVLRSAKDEYGKSYANAGLTLSDEEEIRVQCLYILNNLGSWRGEEARNTKEIFKRFSKK